MAYKSKRAKARYQKTVYRADINHIVKEKHARSAIRKAKIALNLCTADWCKEVAVSGIKLCLRHQTAFNEKNKQWRARKKARALANAKDRAFARANQLCTQCGDSALTGTSLCAKHLAAHRARSAKYEQGKRSSSRSSARALKVDVLDLLR